MGQESLEKLSIEKYLLQWEKGLNEEVDKQYLKDHFMIGDGGDKSKIEFYQLYLKTFCTDNCELSNWIWKKINGYFEDKVNNKVNQLKDQSVCNIVRVYDSKEFWSDVQW